MNRHKPYIEMLARRPELAPYEELDLHEHLRSCLECQHIAAAYAAQTRLLRSLPQIDPPPALRAGVLRQIRESTPARSRWFMPPIFLVAPLAAVLLVAVGVLAFLNRPHSSGSNAIAPIRHCCPQRATLAPVTKNSSQASLPTPRRTARHAVPHRTSSIPTQAPRPTFGAAPVVGLLPTAHPSAQAIPPPVVSQRLPPTSAPSRGRPQASRPFHPGPPARAGGSGHPAAPGQVSSAGSAGSQVAPTATPVPAAPPTVAAAAAVASPTSPAVKVLPTRPTPGPTPPPATTSPPPPTVGPAFPGPLPTPTPTP